MNYVDTVLEYIKSIANKGYKEIDNCKRYSINCILFKKEFWNNINIWDYDNEHDYCYNNDINKAKIYESALDESIYLTINYFNEIRNYLKEPQSNLFNISYDLTEKYYNDFQV